MWPLALGNEQMWIVDLKKTLYRDQIERLFVPIVAEHKLKLGYSKDVSVLDRGDLEVQILADFKDPAAYTRQLRASFPDMVKSGQVYLRTQMPSGDYNLSLYR